MMCSWNALLSILPPWIRDEVDKQGRESLIELRMRINAPPELVLQSDICWLRKKVEDEDIAFCINAASRYSPWVSSTMAQGYITSTGGHRIGICGEALYKNGNMSGMKKIRSVCIRVARDFIGISQNININQKNILILGAPGWGKTTLLRDLIRRIGNTETVGVIDTRGELFPEGIYPGKRVDVLTGCLKTDGLDMILRTMGPSRIALDEITASEDASALIHTVGCGIGILATAHASSISDMMKRPIYRKIWEEKIFDSIVIMHPDKSYHEERIK